MFVLVSLTLFQSSNVNTSLLQKVSHFIYSYTSCLPYFLFSCTAQSKSHVQKSRQSHQPVFWKFPLQNLGTSPKSLHTKSEWINSNCHRLVSLCPLFHFCWKWGVHHSPCPPFPNFPLFSKTCKILFWVDSLRIAWCTTILRGPPFSLEWRVMNFWKYLGNILWPPYLMIKNFMTPPPPRYNVEETCNSQCAFCGKYAFWGLLNWTKFSLKFVATQ